MRIITSAHNVRIKRTLPPSADVRMTLGMQSCNRRCWIPHLGGHCIRAEKKGCAWQRAATLFTCRSPHDLIIFLPPHCPHVGTLIHAAYGRRLRLALSLCSPTCAYRLPLPSRALCHMHTPLARRSAFSARSAYLAICVRLYRAAAT